MLSFFKFSRAFEEVTVLVIYEKDFWWFWNKLIICVSILLFTVSDEEILL